MIQRLCVPSLKQFYALMISLVLFFSFVPIKSIATGSFQLSVVPGCNENTLSWSPLPQASTYQAYLFLADGTTYPLFDFPRPDLFHSHKDLAEGKEYCYVVIAYDKDAKEIGKSNKACAKPISCKDQVEDDCEIELKYTVGKNQYFVNDVPYEMETPPVIKESRMYLVISFVTKHIPGTTINWDGAKQQITIKTAEGKIIKLWIGNPKAEVDGKMVDIDPANPGKGAPFIESGRTKVPMRFVGNHLNAKIDWFGATSTVVLTVQDIVNCGCTWMEGCLADWTEAPSNQIQVFLNPNCDETSRPTPYLIDKNLKSQTDQLDLVEYLGKWTGPGKIRKGKMKICVNRLNQVHHWDPMPIPDECTWICGCVRGFDVKDQYIKIWWDKDCNSPDDTQVLTLLNATPDSSNHHFPSFQAYFESCNSEWCCIELCYDNSTPPKVVAWKATPEKMPNCCQTTQLTIKICGCIVRMVTTPDTNGNYSVNVATDCKTDQSPFDLVLNFPATLLDLNKNKNVFTNFYTDLGGPPKKLCFEAEYDPVTKIVIKWWAYPEKTPPDCCPPAANKTGRIFGQVVGNCTNPITIKIEGTGNTSYSGAFATNASTGFYQTSPENMIDCILPCPGTYRVTPVPIPGVTFSPPFHDIDMKECCENGKSYEASFKCLGGSPSPTTLCGCIISYALKPIPTGKGTAAYVTFVPNCDPETPQNLHQFVLNNSLKASNSVEYTLNASDECYQPPLGMPSGNAWWTMREYIEKWNNGTSHDPITGKNRWCVTLTIDPTQILDPDYSQIISWEMHPEKECKGKKCCDVGICGCILDYGTQHPGYPNYWNILFQADCNGESKNLAIDPGLVADNACNYNMSQDLNCWDPEGHPWTIDTYADNNPYGTNSRPTTYDQNRRWCVKIWLDLNDPNKIIKWEMFPQEKIINGESKCDCTTCIEEVCQGCIESLEEVSLHRWKAVFDKDCNPNTDDKVIRYITSQQNYEYLKAILQSCQTAPQKLSHSLSQVHPDSILDYPCKVKQLPNPEAILPANSYLPLSIKFSRWFSKVLANLRGLFVKKIPLTDNHFYTSNSSTFSQAGTKTWTTDNDFIEGSPMGLNHGPDQWNNDSNSGQGAPHDQLKMTFPGSTYPFIWVPNHKDSSISLVATSTTTFNGHSLVAGTEYGRYKTSPQNPNGTVIGDPSRTTVDLDGNCWVANRGCDTVVKIINRFVNPIVDISNPPNGIQTSTDASHLAWGKDDAVVWEVDLGATQGIFRPGNQDLSTYTNTQGLRSASIDRNNCVWVGGRYSQNVYHIIYNETGQPQIAQTINTGGRPYGSVIDKCGFIYIQDRFGITRIDPDDYSKSFMFYPKDIGGYGIALDPEIPDTLFTTGFKTTGSGSNGQSAQGNPEAGSIWKVYSWKTSSWSNNTELVKLDESYDSVAQETNEIPGFRGLTLSNGSIWVAGCQDHQIRRYNSVNLSEAPVYLPTESNILPSGVAVDSDGHCWIIGIDSNLTYEYKYNASFHSIELIGNAHSVGPSDDAKGHYAYSDLTGLMANSIAAQHGRWSAIQDSGCEDAIWTISWNDLTPEHTSIEYYAQLSPDGNIWSAEEQILSSGSTVPGSGRYIRITVKMTSTPDCKTNIDDFPSPILYDITASWKGDCGNSCCIYACEMPDPSSSSDMIIYSIKPHIGQDPCCGGNRGGRIKGTIRGNCNPGLTINIYLQSTGQLVWSGTTDSAGNYDTGADCVLICGETYRVEPIPRLDGCNTLTIQPTNHIVTIKNCCPPSANNPGYEIANFTCDCKPYTGRIWGKVTGDCQPPTTIKIEGTGATSYSGTFTTDIYTGQYQTSGSTRDCILPCPGTYRVTPVPVPGVTFSPPYRDIDMKKCCYPDYFSYQADFKCEPTGQKSGRIKVKLPSSCFRGTSFNITDVAIGSVNNYGINDDGIKSGVFDTECTLICGKTYQVEPVNLNFAFSPTYHTVTIKNCCPDGFEMVEFDCKPTQKTARIEGIVSGSCNPEVKVAISDTAGNVVWSGNTNSIGYFETSARRAPCILNCPGTYKIVVSKKDCTFTPESQTVTFSERECCEDGQFKKVEFKCECKPPSCCDWLFRTRPELRLRKLELCPGETMSIEHYEVFNNCPKDSNALTFAISFPNDGKIVSVSPSSFTLQAQERKTLQITIKMPECKVNDTVSFPMKISTRECGEKEVEFKAYCKDCWCKHLSKIIKVTKLDLRGGWLEGTPADSKTPIRFYFDATQKQWANIKIDQCIEICYEERKDRAGNTINWALDYQVVECPKGMPVKQYQVQNTLITDRILFEKEEIQRTKKA